MKRFMEGQPTAVTAHIELRSGFGNSTISSRLDALSQVLTAGKPALDHMVAVLDLCAPVEPKGKFLNADLSAKDVDTHPPDSLGEQLTVPFMLYSHTDKATRRNMLALVDHVLSGFETGGLDRKVGGEMRDVSPHVQKIAQETRAKLQEFTQSELEKPDSTINTKKPLRLSPVLRNAVITVSALVQAACSAVGISGGTGKVPETPKPIKTSTVEPGVSPTEQAMQSWVDHVLWDGTKIVAEPEFVTRVDGTVLTFNSVDPLTGESLDLRYDFVWGAASTVDVAGRPTFYSMFLIDIVTRKAYRFAFLPQTAEDIKNHILPINLEALEGGSFGTLRFNLDPLGIAGGRKPENGSAYFGTIEPTITTSTVGEIPAEIELRVPIAEVDEFQDFGSVHFGALAAFETPIPEPTITPEVIAIHPVPGASVVEDLNKLPSLQGAEKLALYEKIGIQLQEDWKTIPVLTEIQVEALKKQISTQPLLDETIYNQLVNKPQMRFIRETDFYNTATVYCGKIGETIVSRAAYIDPKGHKHAVVELIGPYGREIVDITIADHPVSGNLDFQELAFASLQKTGSIVRMAIIYDWNNPPARDDWDLKPIVDAMPQSLVDQLKSLVWPEDGFDAFQVVVFEITTGDR